MAAVLSGSTVPVAVISSATGPFSAVATVTGTDGGAAGRRGEQANVAAAIRAVRSQGERTVELIAGESSWWNRPAAHHRNRWRPSCRYRGPTGPTRGTRYSAI